MDCFPELQILICEFSQINLNPKKGNLRNGISFFIARSAFGYMHDTRIPHPRIVSQPPPLRGTSFQRKENAAFPIAKPFPRIVISSASEKSFSFAVRRDREGSGERETCFMRLGEYGVSCRRLYEGKRKRGTKKIPRLRSG